MNNAFAMACDDGDADAVRKFLAEGADPDTVDDGFPVLYQAAAGGHAALVELLLSANASVDTPNEEGATPLCIAAQNGACVVRAPPAPHLPRLEGSRRDGRCICHGM